MIEIKEISCKTALSKSLLPGLTYSLNPYHGCQHACVYCYAPNVLNVERERWGKFVNIRRNMPNILSKELKKKDKAIVGISTVTDPYQPLERKYKLTRYCLEQLLKYDFPICIQTKSDLVLRDLDLISKFSDAEVGLTITTLKERERKILEPNASSIVDRLKVLKKISEADIKTYVFFGPIYPTIEIQDIPKIVEAFADQNVDYVMVDKFNLKRGVWDSIKNALARYPDMKHIFYRRLFLDKEYYVEIFSAIEEACKKNNIGFEKAF
jgi:DNA repair photolyase